MVIERLLSRMIRLFGENSEQKKKKTKMEREFSIPVNCYKNRVS